ncbi:MAG: cobyrinate a,c-diamide synthase [Actinobacteria bacterium]|nr:cobyrinate a,c-diamide synthase [Actinomycetota bacterium]
MFLIDNMSAKIFPRIVIAGTSSGAGKTTIALAIMAALTRRGLCVQGFKVGPDFIDPGYYGMVTGHIGRNLDTWMIGKEKTIACLLNAAKTADISVIEGVMGFYDGKDGLVEGSTADTASAIDSPVLVTIDCSKMGSSAGAIALGFLKYDDKADIRGFLLNKIGSDHHEAMAKRAVENATGLPVIGCIKRSAEVTIPERHLGLITQSETGLARSYVDTLSGLAEKYIDLDAIVRISKSAPIPRYNSNQVFRDIVNASKVRVGVALDRAFSFYYHDNFDLLEAFGAELVFFSPIKDRYLPKGLDGLYIGGGYPEVYARELAANRPLAAEVKQAVEDGIPVYAECGGLMYLSRRIEDFDGYAHDMSGALPIACKMRRRPVLGYREVRVSADSIVTKKGDTLRGHEFHYSTITDIGGGLARAYRLPNASDEGFIYNNTLASYIHLHFAGRPEFAERFVSLCREKSRGD